MSFHTVFQLFVPGIEHHAPAFEKVQLAVYFPQLDPVLFTLVIIGFFNGLKLIKLAVSLGGTESLAEHPGTMTHSDIAKDDQLKIGITPAMCRISVGLEDPKDLIADVSQALDMV